MGGPTLAVVPKGAWPLVRDVTGAWAGPARAGCARVPSQNYLHHHVAPAVGRAVVDHGDDGHAQVAADAEGDAEAQAAHDGDDVAARQAEARTVAQRRLLLRHLQRLPILRQLDGLPGLLLLLQHPARQNGERQVGRGLGTRRPALPVLRTLLR